MLMFFFFKQKTAYEMRISDWSSDVCSSDLDSRIVGRQAKPTLITAALGVRQFGKRPLAFLQKCIVQFQRQQVRIWKIAVIVRIFLRPHRASFRLVGIEQARFLNNLPTRFQHRSEEHTSELKSLMRNSYAVF